jgi:lipoate---protein ligase
MRITFRHMPARQAIAADEALLDTPGTPHFWIAESPAVVVGLALHHRLASVVDLDRCRARGVGVVERRAGGGALLLDSNVLCGAIALPAAEVVADVTQSYRWLGDRLVAALVSLGVRARRVEVAEARSDVHRLRTCDGPVAGVLLNTCYGALSPHEVVVDSDHAAAKLVGLAQVRRREAALFQFGILLDTQSALADCLHVPTEPDRDLVRAALLRRTVGLASLTSRSVSEVAAAIADAMPCAR